jgi:di/tricarboxylate transporter
MRKPMTDLQLILAILVVAIVLFIWNRLPVVIVAMGTGLALYFTGLLSVEQTFASYGEPVILFIAGLFVVAAGLEATGISAGVGHWVARVVGTSRTRLLALAMVLVAVLSPLISMNGAVAALVPVVMILAVRMAVAPSQLLIPLAFASGAGSKLALTGTPKNVLIHDASMDAGYGGFGFFEFAWVGVPLLIGSVGLVVLVGRYLLPVRPTAHLPADLGRHARTLVEQYRLDAKTVQLRLRETSPLVGRPRAGLERALEGGLRLVAVLDGTSGEPRRGSALAAGDVLVVQGEEAAIADFAAVEGAALADADAERLANTLLNRRTGLAEVVVPPRSDLVGRTLASGMITESGDLVVLAIQRAGVDQGPGEVMIAAGDHLLLQGTWEALEARLAAPEVLLVERPDAVRRQAVPFGRGAWTMIAIIAAMVGLLASGLLPAAVAVLLAAMAVVLFRLVSVPEAYRAIDWTTVILVAALMPLSTAMYETGTAKQLAEHLVSLVGDAGPIAFLAGLFVLTAILGQLISNTATALILIPIAVATAAEFDVSAQPVLMSLNVAAAAAFLTPIATPPNLIVMGPGGYRFGDFWKLGLVLMALYFVVAVFWVPLVWPL